MPALGNSYQIAGFIGNCVSSQLAYLLCPSKLNRVDKQGCVRAQAATRSAAAALRLVGTSLSATRHNVCQDGSSRTLTHNPHPGKQQSETTRYHVVNLDHVERARTKHSTMLAAPLLLEGKLVVFLECLSGRSKDLWRQFLLKNDQHFRQ